MFDFVTAFAATALIATPAQAGERSVTVRHADLDLNSDAGRARLNHRIAMATEQVCGSYANVAADEGIAIDRCRDSVRRDVARQRTGRSAAQVARR